MLAFVGLVGNLGSGAVVVHRLGRRHIGVRPFKTERNGGQIEDKLMYLANSDTICISQEQKKNENASVEEKKAIRKQKFTSGG